MEKFSPTCTYSHSCPDSLTTSLNDGMQHAFGTAEMYAAKAEYRHECACGICTLPRRKVVVRSRVKQAGPARRFLDCLHSGSQSVSWMYVNTLGMPATPDGGGIARFPGLMRVRNEHCMCNRWGGGGGGGVKGVFWTIFRCLLF